MDRRGHYALQRESKQTCSLSLDIASTVCQVTIQENNSAMLAFIVLCLTGRKRCLRINWTTDTDHNPSHSMTAPDRCVMHKDANDVLVQEGPEALNGVSETLSLYLLRGRTGENHSLAHSLACWLMSW